MNDGTEPKKATLTAGPAALAAVAPLAEIVAAQALMEMLARPSVPPGASRGMPVTDTCRRVLRGLEHGLLMNREPSPPAPRGRGAQRLA